MPQVYIRKILYDKMVELGLDASEFVNSTVAIALEKKEEVKKK